MQLDQQTKENLVQLSIDSIMDYSHPIRDGLLNGADLRGMDLRGADFSSCSMIGCDLRGADLRRVNFINARLWGAKLSDAQCSGAGFCHAELTHADFYQANCSRCNFTEAYLGQADLTCADFSDTRLIETRFPLARAIETNFTKALFGDNELTGFYCLDANFDGARYDRYEIKGVPISIAPLDGYGIEHFCGVTIFPDNPLRIEIRGTIYTEKQIRNGTKDSNEEDIKECRHIFLSLIRTHDKLINPSKFSRK